MLKQTILAVATLTTLSVAAVPVTTAPALAQSQWYPGCTAGPRCDNGGEGSTYSCTEPLGHLRRVYKHELEEITNPNRVSIMPICVGESYGIFRNDGNAGALRTVIADNDAMTEALFRKNFRSDDVVGVRMIAEDKVILYVLPYHNVNRQ